MTTQSQWTHLSILDYFGNENSYSLLKPLHYWASLLQQRSFHPNQYNTVLYTVKTGMLSEMGVYKSSESTSRTGSTHFPNTYHVLASADAG